jgi:hypothetical protein
MPSHQLTSFDNASQLFEFFIVKQFSSSDNNTLPKRLCSTVMVMQRYRYDTGTVPTITIGTLPVVPGTKYEP